MLLTFALCLPARAAPDAFEAYLRPPHPAADGFAPLPTEVRAGAEARALAHGRVAEVGAGGSSVVLEHLYYENHALLRARSEYSGLTGVTLKRGALVTRGQGLGRVEGRHAVALHTGRRLSPEEAQRFTASRARLPLPAEEPVLLLISHEHFELRLYEKGRERARMEAGFGQAAGAKQERGDNRTPKGMYFIVQKVRGEIPGPYSAYYGGHWMRVNYPNPWDADRGVAQGWLKPEVRARIARAWEARQGTDASTRLGSGIGLHGWAEGDWSLNDSGGRLTWGCVTLHNPDIAVLYDKVPHGTMVVLF